MIVPLRTWLHKAGLRALLRSAAGIGLPLAMLATPGCALNERPLETSLGSDLSCVDDSSRCLAARQRALKALMADDRRAWLRQRPSASAYASGVRLFAMKKGMGGYTCQELAMAASEARAAPGVLRGPEGRHLTPGQISRGAMLGDEVARDLAREQKKRCG